MIRKTTRTLTGRAARVGEMVLGTRHDGTPGATLHFSSLPSGSVSVCFSDPEVVLALITDLSVAYNHLTGKGTGA